MDGDGYDVRVAERQVAQQATAQTRQMYSQMLDCTIARMITVGDDQVSAECCGVCLRRQQQGMKQHWARSWRESS